MRPSFPTPIQGPRTIRVPATSLPFLIAFVAGAMSISLGAFWLSALGISAFTYYLVRFLQEVGVDVPIESFILVIASTQWIIGPLLSYAGLSNHYKMYMYVPEADYIALAVPCVILYSLGLYTFRSRKRIGHIASYAEHTRQIVNTSGFLPFYLIGIGFVFSLVVDKLPASLAFPGYVLSSLKYVGLIYLLFSDRQENKIAILIIAFAVTFLSSLWSKMFHDLILWTVFIGMYAAYIFRPAMARKILMVCLGISFIFVIQAAKDEYRARLRTEGQRAEVQTFIQSIESRFEDDAQLRSNNIERMVHRLNQGWIISRIMQHVPAKVPFAEGETIVTAIKASLLPRILYPDKPEAGGKVNYEKYTGYYLQIGTSMGISLLGEAYINYDVKGAWIFMFVFGVISSFVIRQIFQLSARYPTIWLWLPLILFHFVKAETELLVQLNFLLKSILIVYVFVWANKHFLRLKV
jgi:hypothetical protein